MGGLLRPFKNIRTLIHTKRPSLPSIESLLRIFVDVEFCPELLSRRRTTELKEGRPFTTRTF